MSLQRKHFLLSYLKTLSVGPAGTHDLPHGSPALYQLSQPVGGQSAWVTLTTHSWRQKVAEKRTKKNKEEQRSEKCSSGGYNVSY